MSLCLLPTAWVLKPSPCEQAGLLVGRPHARALRPLAWHCVPAPFPSHVLWWPPIDGQFPGTPSRRSPTSREAAETKHTEGVCLRRRRGPGPARPSPAEAEPRARPGGGRAPSPLTCCLCSFTSLRSCSTSIFSFSFSGRSSMWRAGILAPELGGWGVQLWRWSGCKCSQTRARPQTTAVPAPDGSASRARGSPLGSPLTPGVPGVPGAYNTWCPSLCPRSPQPQACSREPGTARPRTWTSFALQDGPQGCWPGAWLPARPRPRGSSPGWGPGLAVEWAKPTFLEKQQKRYFLFLFFFCSQVISGFCLWSTRRRTRLGRTERPLAAPRVSDTAAPSGPQLHAPSGGEAAAVGPRTKTKLSWDVPPSSVLNACEHLRIWGHRGDRGGTKVMCKVQGRVLTLNNRLHAPHANVLARKILCTPHLPRFWWHLTPSVLNSWVEHLPGWSLSSLVLVSPLSGKWYSSNCHCGEPGTFRKVVFI